MCSRETDRQCHSLLFVKVERFIEDVFDIMTFSGNENVTKVLNISIKFYFYTELSIAVRLFRL